MTSRGRGFLVPLLLLLAVLPMMAAQEIGLRTAQSIAIVWTVASGAWVAWFGRKSLLDASELLGRPLAWYEWVFDFALTEPRPFHSFMLIQMPWWTVAYAAAAIYMASAVLSGAPSTTP